MAPTASAAVPPFLTETNPRVVTTTDEAAVVAATNKERKAAGLPEFAVSMLTRMARELRRRWPGSANSPTT